MGSRDHAAAVGTQTGPHVNDARPAFHSRTVEAHASEARNRMTLRTGTLQRRAPGTDDPRPGPDLIPQSD
jgi:hypothetical protein